MVCMQADGSYQYTMEKPDEGWTAFFIQVYIRGNLLQSFIWQGGEGATAPLGYFCVSTWKLH